MMSISNFRSPEPTNVEKHNLQLTDFMHLKIKVQWHDLQNRCIAISYFNRVLLQIDGL